MGNFDHHQRGFNELNKSGTRLSTFGMVVKHLQLAMTIKLNGEFYGMVEQFSIKVDDHDNGVTFSPELKWISDFNDFTTNPDENFNRVIQVAKDGLTSLFAGYLIHIEDSSLINESVKETIAAKNPVVVIEDKVPVDERLNKYEHLKLAVMSHDGGKWKIQSLNKGLQRDFSCRCPAPENWRGRSDFKVEGVDVVFCHAGGFLTVAKSKEDAIKLAEMIVQHNTR